MTKFWLVLKYLFLSVASFISVFPFVWMILGTTNETRDIVAGKIQVGKMFLQNFHDLFANDLNFTKALLNSAIIAVITTVLALFISSIAGYGFEIYRSKGREIIFSILLLSMMVPFSALMIPLFRMFRNLAGTPFGLNTLFVVIVPTVATALLIFLFRQSIKAFPISLVEAARIDGLGEFQIFLKIYMPTAKNIYAAAGIITFMTSWNNYLWPLISLSSPEKRTLPLVLSAMGASYTPNYGMLMTGIVIATLPIALVFFLLQRQFVAGMLGSVK